MSALSQADSVSGLPGSTVEIQPEIQSTPILSTEPTVCVATMAAVSSAAAPARLAFAR